MPMSAAAKMVVLLRRGGFSPASLPGLALWLDASDASTLFQDSAGTTPATADGDVVGRWNDKSGNGRHATQAVTANKPSYKVGHSRIQFDGNDALSAGYTATLGDFTVFTVFRAEVVTNFGRVIHKAVFGSPASGIWIGRDATVANSYVGGILESDAPFGQVVSLTDTQRNLIMLQRAGTTHLIKANNGTAQTKTASATLTDAAAVTIGSNTTAAFLNGSVSEVLLWDRALTSDEYNAVNAYLVSKWSVGS